MKHLFISVALVVLSMSRCYAANQYMAEQQETVQQQDTTVIITETDSLKLFRPIFYGGIGLCCGCGENPPMSFNHVFVAAAAYTKSYNWTKFNHNLIAGPHIDSEYHEGYNCEANSGAFYYVHSSGRWGFVYRGYRETLRDLDGKGSGFSQVMLVFNGSICKIHKEAKPDSKRLRRAICDIDNELYIIDSKHPMTMPDFAMLLKNAGAFHALYMDMGSMRFSAYKEHYEGDWTEIHPRNPKSRYATNYLVFYYVD